MNELTPMTTDNLPAFPAEDLANMPLALRVHFDDRIYHRVARIAQRMARSTMGTPQHLRGNEDACFEVCARSLVWGLDPGMVANSTFDAGMGRFGFEGKLVAAILLSSRRLDGGIQYEHFGDWSKVQGKFRMQVRDKQMQGRNGPWTKKVEVAVPAWSPEDEVGLGVTARCRLRGEKEPREVSVLLVQCQPRNATTWPLDPMGQICNVAVRRLANRATPEMLFGVRFDDEIYEAEAEMKDVTPAREDGPPPPAPEPMPIDLAEEGIQGAGVMEDPVEPKPEPAKRQGRPTNEERKARLLAEIEALDSLEAAEAYALPDNLPAKLRDELAEALLEKTAEFDAAELANEDTEDSPPAPEEVEQHRPQIGVVLDPGKPDDIRMHPTAAAALQAMLRAIRATTPEKAVAIRDENSTLLDGNRRKPELAGLIGEIEQAVEDQRGAFE